MKYLLDTCVIAELAKPSPNLKVIHWLNEVPSDRLFLSVLTIAEIRKGIVKMPESKRKNYLSEWINTLLEDYKDRIISIDLRDAENWGFIQGNAEKKGRPMSTIDGLIAAQTYSNNLTLVTRNESDFSQSAIPINNPWNS